ncbi:RBR-type E3 ubiquitin transferase [Mycena venus]|uniref:RBR-type E3 ubiquitin transferase n=1 Tax=Mycena venus TaxID=2733690 RepID=A0A8H7CJ49_9AGAR|nr:RBR-type E3 ubiquitin transferase [Mycena venus]
MSASSQFTKEASLPEEKKKLGLPDDFPPELLGRVLVGLSYQDLLSSLAVSHKWKTIIEHDPALQVEMFKKASEEYVEPGDGSPGNDHDMVPGSEKIRMHPALSEISFVFKCDPVDDAFLFNYLSKIPLSASVIANDLATIPAVHTLTIQIKETTMEQVLSFNVEVENDSGVTLTDIFSKLKDVAATQIETLEGPMPMACALESECLYSAYNGFGEIKRTGTTLSVLLLYKT